LDGAVTPVAALNIPLFSDQEPLTLNIQNVLSLEYDTSKEYDIYSNSDLEIEDLPSGSPLGQERKQLEETLRRRNFWYLSDQLSLQLSRGVWLVGTELDFDGIQPVDLNVADTTLEQLRLKNPDPALEQTVRLARYYLQTEFLGATLRGGDCFVDIGRGLAANIAPQPYRSEENVLKGASVTYLGDLLTVKAFGGWLSYYDRIRSPVLNARGKNLMSDGYLGGGEISLRFFDFLEWGVLAVSGRYDQAETDAKEMMAHLVGTRLEVPSLWDGRLSIASEFDYALSPYFAELEQDLAPADYQSYASYGTASFLQGNWTALLEWKDYHNFGYLWNNPPSLELDGILFKKMNVQGVRARVDYHIEATASNLFANLGFFDDADFGALYKIQYEGGTFAAVKSLHLYGGLEQDVNERSHFTALAGYRALFGREADQVKQEDDEVTVKIPGDGRMLHAQLSYKTSVHGNLGFEFLIKTMDFRFVADNLEKLQAQVASPDELEELLAEGADKTVTEFIEDEANISAIIYQKINLTLIFDYSTFGVSSDEKTAHPALLAKYKISDSAHFSLFYGSRKKGFQCSGGECREYPAFEGFKGELSMQF
jgi:hypothetical protein